MLREANHLKSHSRIQALNTILLPSLVFALNYAKESPNKMCQFLLGVKTLRQWFAYKWRYGYIPNLEVSMQWFCLLYHLSSFIMSLSFQNYKIFYRFSTLQPKTIPVFPCSFFLIFYINSSVLMFPFFLFVPLNSFPNP